jgi:protein-S-isoprenylcysteine O-methyltransferase Ste14
MYAPRPILLLVLSLFTLGAFAWPVLRMLRTSGRTGVVAHRAPRPVHRVVSAALAVHVGGLVAWSTLYLWLGPERLGVWPTSSLLRASALVSLMLAFCVMVAAQSQMGRSWRVGIDAGKTDLVTGGLFGVVRNPIYSAIALATTGVALLTPGCWTLVGALHAAFVVALQARLEEEHLTGLHGDAYRTYAARVGRFIPGVGRLREQ